MDNDKLCDYIINYRVLNEVAYNVTVNRDGHTPFDDGLRGFTLSYHQLKPYIKNFNESVMLKYLDTHIKDLPVDRRYIFDTLYLNKILVHKGDFLIDERNEKINKILNDDDE